MNEALPIEDLLGRINEHVEILSDLVDTTQLAIADLGDLYLQVLALALEPKE